MAKKHSPRFLAIVNAARDEIQECEASDLPELIAKGAVLIDVRERHEFEAGPILMRFTLVKASLNGILKNKISTLTRKLSYIVEEGFAAP